MRGDDVLDEITGSIGLTGAVDGALILKRERGQHEATLFVTGRDIEHEQQLALRFDPLTAMWTLMGTAEEVTRTKERQEILDLLSEQLPEGMSPRQVAEALGKNYHTTRCLLRKMEAADEIRHVKNHYVAIPTDSPRNQRNQCNQRNQSVPSALQPAGQMACGEEPCPPANDYADYTDDSVSANGSQIRRITPPLAGASLHHPAAPEDLLSQDKDMQDAQGHRDVDVINFNHCNHCNQCNQSMSATTQASDHVEQSSPTCIDYTDYADVSISSNVSHTYKAPPQADASLQPSSTPEEHFSQSEGVQGDIALYPNDASPGKARAGPLAPGKKSCPHHPHARWIRFDPSGQAWCDHMDCWDCYRLMKIGEALDYRSLSKYTRGIVALEQGIDAWSSFVTSQGSFAVLSATGHAIAFCKALELEVPDLSGEVQRLVSAWE